MQKCKSLRIHVKKRSYNNINYCKENVTGNVIKDSTRTPMTGIQVRVCDPVIFTSLSTCSRWRREECPLGLPHGAGDNCTHCPPWTGGAGGGGHPLAGRGGSSTNRFLS